MSSERHVAASSRVGRGAQRVLELGSVPLAGEHFRRRPAEQLTGLGFEIEKQERFGPVGLVERVTAGGGTDLADRQAATFRSE